MIKFNVTTANNTTLQVIANSMEDVLQAFKAEIVGIVRDTPEQCTSPDDDRMEWIKRKDFKCYELYYNHSLKTIAVQCSPVHSYPLGWFASRLKYSEDQTAELISVVEKIFSISSDVLVVEPYEENYFSAKVKLVTLIDSCLIRLMEKVLKTLQ